MAHIVAIALLAVFGAASASQPGVSGRHLAQSDPFTVFNEPSAATSAAAGAPSVNTNGVPAVAASATTVPVLGTLAAPLPRAAYPAVYAPGAVGGVAPQVAPTAPAQYGYVPAATAAPAVPAAAAYGYVPAGAAAYPAASVMPAATYTPASAAPAFDPVAAAAGIGAAGPAAAAAPTPTLVPPPAPAKPPPPLPAGMIYRSQLKEQVPANASALPIIRVPEGTTARLTYVCDITGQLYIAVNRDRLIACPSGKEADLAKLAEIKGARPVKCPDNRLACPGNFAVDIVVKLNNTLEEFKAAVPRWRANVALAASVDIGKVVITDVELLQQPAPAPATPAAALAAPAAQAATAQAPARAVLPAAALMAGPQPPVAPLRRLQQAMAAPRARAAAAPVEDTAAVLKIEELPKPRILVTTTIQPLTEMEAMGVLGTTKSDWFQSTFTQGSAKMGMRLVDGFKAEQAKPGQEYSFPDAKAAANATNALPRRSVNATDVDATNLTAVALTPEEAAANAAKRQQDAAALAAAAAANGTAGVGERLGGLAARRAAAASGAAGAAPRIEAAALAAALCLLAALA